MKMAYRCLSSWLVLVFGLPLFAAAPLAFAADDDILVADFEGADYGGWTATGEAFGPAPAQGTLPGQMNVSGFQGRGLVNSFYGGDQATGTLTSPVFKVQRKHVNFLIGGGAYENTTCMNLLINGKVVRTATGPNRAAGGSEALDWQSWDVTPWKGKEAVIQIVDDRTGGWGHINVDHIVQADTSAAGVTIHREMLVNRPYLHLPVKTGAKKRLMRFLVDGQLQRQFEIELADGHPDFWTYADVDEFRGRTLRVEVDRMRPDSSVLDALPLNEQRPAEDELYQESLRPQFHFTAARGWLNDPNGLVYYDGEYHLFFQHNPYGVNWGNMTWGHAVSTDLMHWRQLPEALHQDALGTMFSGSAVVDHQNTAGWQRGEHEAIVCMYTSAGGTNAQSQGQPFTQSLAYSTDRGRTWTKYEKNPVLGHIRGGNRDPKVIWHPETSRWVMVLYLDGNDFAIYTSPDLKTWEQTCDVHLPDSSECPDFFPLSVDGDAGHRKWVFWGANGNYLIGDFDGTTFTKEYGPLPSQFGANDYAAQTYSDIPSEDGRRIQISWMRGGNYQGMPFNQQMTVPRVLNLRTTSEGIRLFIQPVKEIEQLRGRRHDWQNVALAEMTVPLNGVAGDLWDIDATLEVGDAKTVGIKIGPHEISYSPGQQRLTALGRDAPLRAEDGRLKLRILVDRTSIEVFAADGRVQLASCYRPDDAPRTCELFATGGTATAARVQVWEMQSIWPHAR